MYKLLSALALSLISLDAAAKTIYITPYGGIFNVQRDDRKGMGGAELRFNFVHDIFVPKAGGFITSKGSTYFYGGFNLEIPICQNTLYLIPGFAVGSYAKHKGKSLGGPLEFHSTIELNYKLPNTHRIGVAFGHISNASIYKKNPGEEDLVLSYSIPITF